MVERIPVARIEQPRQLVDPVAGYAAPEAGQWRSTQSAKRCVPEAYREAGEPMARKAAQPAGEAVDPVAQPCRQGVAAIEIGSASGREGVCPYVSISVVAVSCKKKKTTTNRQITY